MGFFSDMDIELKKCDVSDKAHRVLEENGFKRGSEEYSRAFKHWFDSKYQFEEVDYFKRRLEDRLNRGDNG